MKKSETIGNFYWLGFFSISN